MRRGQVLEVGKLKALGLAIALVAAMGTLGGCGSDGEESASGGIPSGTADRLAEMSDEIAAALEAGDVCGAAARADDLRAAVSEAEISAELRSEVEAGADQLVNGVNCDSEPEATTTEEEDGKHERDEEREEEDGDSGSSGEGPDSSGPPGQDQDFAPPGKIKGGI
jgi:hypothetical protein